MGKLTSSRRPRVHELEEITDTAGIRKRTWKLGYGQGVLLYCPRCEHTRRKLYRSRLTGEVACRVCHDARHVSERWRPARAQHVADALRVFKLAADEFESWSDKAGFDRAMRALADGEAVLSAIIERRWTNEMVVDLARADALRIIQAIHQRTIEAQKPPENRPEKPHKVRKRDAPNSAEILALSRAETSLLAALLQLEIAQSSERRFRGKP